MIDKNRMNYTETERKCKDRGSSILTNANDEMLTDVLKLIKDRQGKYIDEFEVIWTDSAIFRTPVLR